MKSFLLFLAFGLFAGRGVAFAQDPGAKASDPTATLVIKVQTDAARSTGFTSKINAVNGLTVKTVCKSQKKPMWYVLIEMDKQKQPDLNSALEQLGQQDVDFKRMSTTEAEFPTLCAN